MSDSPKGTGFWAVVHSVCAAGIGVKSKVNKERDFQQGNPYHFVVGGVIGTIVFVLSLVIFVHVLIGYMQN